jgi:hypothetical protein
MSINTEPLQQAAFSAIQMQVGQRVLLVLEGSAAHKQYTNIIGWVENEFLILRVPHEDGWIVHIREGMNIDIRLFTGLSIFTFKSRVNHLLLHPRNYMLISFPKEIWEAPMREHRRILTSLKTKILKPMMAPEYSDSFWIKDISTAGAAVFGPIKLGEVDSTIQISVQFELKLTGKTEEVDIEGKIQNIEPIYLTSGDGEQSKFRHGILFVHPDLKLALFVNELEKNAT